MKIAVYCSAKDQIPEAYLLLGDALGKWIAEQGHVLVYGGATGGLMTRVSEAVKAAGGRVIGVVPDRVVRSGRKAANCDECIEVATMSERKQRMREIADCFVCLPGSYGTLDELFDVIGSGTVGEHHRPIYVLNYAQFYAPLMEQIAHMKRLGFLPQEESYKPVFVDSLEGLYEKIR